MPMVRRRELRYPPATMCGICGAIQVEGRPREVLPPGVLDRMTDAMVHRGPDDRGSHVAPGVAFGARRLSIVDLDGGHQPFANEDGRIWAAQNGEIFNHADLRRDLEARGHRFRSRCDTEIIPHLYEEHGTAFPERMRGMFGVVLWDDAARRGVVVRDRLGIKPIYYARSGDLVLFASELKSLLASGMIGTDLDYEAIDAYLTLGFFPGPATPLAQVRKLMPGHRLVVEDGAVRDERWWAYPTPHVAGPRLSEGEYVELLLDKLRESVRLRLMSDVPLGAMLSGGIDSSLIVALMSDMVDEPVKTFSVGFAGLGEGNELADARTVARLYGTDHHELELSLDEYPIALDELVWHMDEPIADLSALGFIALCELARRHVTVALSGQGADELLGGYRKHRAAAYAERLDWFPAPLRAGLARAASFAPRRLRRPFATLSARDAADRLIAMSGNVDAAQRRRMVRGPLAALDGGAARRAITAYDGIPDAPLAATLYLDAKLGLVDDMLHYFDRASMAHSLEVRVPFLDHELVELCAGVPTDLKVRGGITKYVLKQASRGLVPDRIIDKPKVGFFNAAVDGWFASQASGVVSDYLLDPAARYADIIDRGAVAGMIDGHRRDPASSPHGFALLAVLMLEIWLATYLPRALPGGERRAA
ncbi:MAG: asparagine synthase (glutamine-hydrolyzing) [Actinomycetota bacterium]